jgi:hypothetical protein
MPTTAAHRMTADGGGDLLYGKAYPLAVMVAQADPTESKFRARAAPHPSECS